MGNCESASLDQEALTQHKTIEKEIQQDAAVANRKVLLLGAGECGKTTILKQMRQLHTEFTDNELLYYKPLISEMLVTTMCHLIKAAQAMGFEFSKASLKEDAEMIESMVENGEEKLSIEIEIYRVLGRLWPEEAIQQAFRQADTFHINTTARYFFIDLHRISSTQYTPTPQDILNVRAATIGVQEVRFKHKAMQFRVFDVAGQKSQRKKWIHLFDDVDAVIFISAISEFDQMMKEDENMNRLQDSLDLFKNIATNEYFQKTSLILFLNKTDLFAKKIQQNQSITNAFGDYQGPNTYNDSLSFIEGKFKTEAHETEKKKVYIHKTCAIDTGQTQTILARVIDIVINRKVGRRDFSPWSIGFLLLSCIKLMLPLNILCFKLYRGFLVSVRLLPGVEIFEVFVAVHQN